MKCQRCWSDQEPAYRVYTDALNKSGAQIDIDLIVQFTLAGQPSYLKSLRVDGHLSSD
jgi:hypothetical protein